MFEEKQEYDITAKASGHIEVRRADIVLKDGIEIARTYHRHVVAPGDDVADQVQIVKDIAKVVQTDEVKEEAVRIEDEFKSR